MDFHFTTEQTLRRADELADYLRGPRLWIPSCHYPDFDEWLERALGALRSESKRAVIALSSGSIVGAVVYQKHRAIPETLEIKNITVRPDARGRHIADFLLRQAEIEGSRDFAARRIVADAKRDNVPIRAFLIRCGYAAVDTVDLYGLQAGLDMMYEKLSFRLAAR